ncbi:MAG: hypothetical protein F6J90_23865 [Moorea sp. SIOASIH]|nr:hypothetical protein [Moorena sp. SIOASIH]
MKYIIWGFLETGNRQQATENRGKHSAVSYQLSACRVSAILGYRWCYLR